MGIDFTVLFFWVTLFGLWMGRTHGGYHASLPHASSVLDYQQEHNHGTQDSHHTDIAYSVSYDDYNYLKQHKNEEQRFPADAGYSTAPESTSFFPVNGNRNNYDPVISHVNEFHSAHYEQQFQDQNSLINIKTEPVVTKHIYFHAPPPDFEEQPVPVVVPEKPKKVYNIVFIKVPSQESRTPALQRLLGSYQSPVEDKTLIYLLVKKPETPEPPPPPVHVTSEHEVFYVKYNEPTNNVHHEEFVENNPNDSQFRLQPGLLNGRI